MSARKINITSDALHELFRYDPETGKLFWKIRAAICVGIGDEAGCVNKQGYRQVSLNHRKYKAHRIIWLMVHGEIRDDLVIDHINGYKLDNRIKNLRLVTHQHNQWNCHTAKGYGWHKSSKKWRALIRINGKQLELGRFDSEDEARRVYLEAKKIYHKI